MSKKTVRKTSGRVKDALIKAGPEKSEIQAELNQDFPGRYKLITAVVLGTMAASAGAVTVNIDSSGNPNTFTAEAGSDGNITVTGGTQLTIGLASTLQNLTEVDATTVKVGSITLSEDNGALKVTGGVKTDGTVTGTTVSGTTIQIGDGLASSWTATGLMRATS